ncbi:Uncharacterised protein [Yersinia rohdei]|uniref:putative phage abortive infection protein n=1 Tax=Yersinia rohdei TaxID=29485 RepID=UPI0005E670B9|nr:putative phage abortive infection protein [Yersinia rohdei]CNI37006.1 Uncharacterised protein [Yersinia rohdei]
MKKTSDTPLSTSDTSDTSDTSEPAEKPTNENEKNFSDYFTDQHVFLVFLVLVIFGVIFFTSDRDLGTFGDFFGGTLNPILTFISVIFLINTMRIQQKELSITRDDLTLTRQEYKKTSQALNTQAIENRFFNILKVHNDIVLNLNLYAHNKNLDYNGVKTFDYIIHRLNNSSHSISNQSQAANTLQNYKKIQESENHILGQYFRNLYQALKLINGYDNEELPLSEKKKYSSILRAQLSTKELAILFLNCLDDICDRGQFKNLLIQYSMLEHLPIQQQDENTFLLANEVIVSGEMISQYKERKIISKIILTKIYGGAFGTNPGVPYNYKTIK